MDDSLVETGPAKTVEVFVLSGRMGEFQRRIDRLQAMAQKLELPLWEVKIDPPQWRAIAPSRSEKLEGRLVHISGIAPVLAGWRFLAKIEHGQGGNLVKPVSGQPDTPQAWHTCSPNCDHCNVKRARSTTYMLQQVETGNIRQVGKTCVTDFLGRAQRDPESFLGMHDFLAELGADFEYDPDQDLGSSMPSSAFGVEPVVLMRTVLKLVQEDGGYVSAEKADQRGCLSTADRLRGAFWSHKPQAVVPDAAHWSQAPNIVDWLKEQKTSDSLWLRNIAFLADRQCIGAKDAGLFASGIVAWNRALQSQLKSERGMGDWIGTPGEKRVLAATLERHAGFDTAYGFKTVLSFRDEEGNSMVWKTQRPPQGLVVGGNYHLLGTVKGHGEYSGEKQTELTRVVIAETELFNFDSLPKFKRLAAVATPDMPDERGHSPLTKAVWSDKVDYARALLTAGADPNQLNQDEVPILAYASSQPMAEVLLEFGARPLDVQDVWLQEMPAEVRALIAAPGGQSKTDFSPGASIVATAPAANAQIVHSGTYCGPIMDINSSSVVQKINRAGDQVVHQRSTFPSSIAIGQIVQVTYANGVACMLDESRSVSLER